MRLPDLHRRILADILDLGAQYPLVITGGYAVQAHDLVHRLSQDLDVATENPAPMKEIIETLSRGLTARGWRVRQVEVDPLSGRLLVSTASGDDQCEVDVLKEAFWQTPVTTEYGPVLALDDVIGTKMRALADRGVARDLIDIHAASAGRSRSQLESLGRRHAREDFSLHDLRDRLAGAQWRDDQEFTAYGLSFADIEMIRLWAQDWADDLDRRLYEHDGD
ncbi:nucleotidyl transferase AbiEii/AbiGii toxin family protein [Spirillospora sp. NPDC049652]